jgi:hypothetical protein
MMAGYEVCFTDRREMDCLPGVKGTTAEQRRLGPSIMTAMNATECE